jgi:hypothetical protein
MSDVIGGIGGFILALIGFLLVFLILAFLSKVSGKGFRRMGSSTPIIRPTDFDNTIDMLKESGSKIKEKVTDTVGKFGLDNYNKVIYQVDKTVSKAASITFTDYILVAARAKELEEASKTLFDPLLKHKFEFQKALAVHQHLHSYLDGLDLDKVTEFFQTHLDLRIDANVVTLFDCIHLENLKSLDKIMADIMKKYWTNALDVQQISKLKDYLLVECFKVPENCFSLEWQLAHAEF